VPATLGVGLRQTCRGVAVPVRPPHGLQHLGFGGAHWPVSFQWSCTVAAVMPAASLRWAPSARRAAAWRACSAVGTSPPAGARPMCQRSRVFTALASETFIAMGVSPSGWWRGGLGGGGGVAYLVPQGQHVV